MKNMFYTALMIVLFSGCCIPWKLPYDKYDYDFDDPDIKELVQVRRKSGLSDTTTIKIINNWVNINVEYDVRVNWQTPSETYYLMEGDCNDIALLTCYFIDRYMELSPKLYHIDPEEGEYDHMIFKCLGEYYNLGDIKNYKVENSWIYEEACTIAEMF